MKLSRFFIFFLVCNATNALRSMDKIDQLVYESDAAQRYEEEKELTRQKINRHKKHQKPSPKKKHTKHRIDGKNTTK